MATKKQSIYIGEELEWLESKALDLRAYIDKNPFSALVDRITYKELKNKVKKDVGLKKIIRL